ncbi:MAG: TetR/AcrR family transcriptional regulator, partial [Paracoccaceae bacterium]|nr:TetR/AcrR family transcriptional regulator [Paracoccaceae bacterium]
MIGSQIDARRGRGRPRGFDEVRALDAAMRIFWAQGYEAASVDTLSRGMGVPRASLYNLFGDKQRLFLSAVAVYANGPFAEVAGQLHGGGGLRADLTAFFDALIRLTASAGARGCLVSCVLADAAGENAGFRQELFQRLEEVEHAIRARLEEGIAAGDLQGAVPVAELARVIAAAARGLTVAARAGVAPERLHATA